MAAGGSFHEVPAGRRTLVRTPAVVYLCPYYTRALLPAAEQLLSPCQKRDVQWHFMNTVKEAIFLQYGSTQPLTTMAIDQQTQMWDSMMEENVRKFSKVAEAIRPSDVKHVPLRILVPGRPAAVQAPITPTDQDGACVLFNSSSYPEGAVETVCAAVLLAWPQVGRGRSGRCWPCCCLEQRSAKRMSTELVSPGRLRSPRRRRRSLPPMEPAPAHSSLSYKGCGRLYGRRCKNYGIYCITQTSFCTCA